MKNKFLLWIDRRSYVVATGKFPGGEVKVTLPSNVLTGYSECRIEAMLLSSDDVMALVMIVDALRSAGYEKIRLTMPYVPYARQDRVCSVGESFSIRAFAKLINSLEFSSVVICDPHSDVTPALIDRCIVQDQVATMMQNLVVMDFMEQAKTQDTYLVCPDAGAAKKTAAIMKAFPQLKGVIYGEKVREMSTGKIIKTEVRGIPDDIANAHMLIIDDICDGGRTFIELSKVIIEETDYFLSLNLYVTHGIFSAGVGVFEIYFDNVWSSYDFEDYK